MKAIAQKATEFKSFLSLQGLDQAGILLKSHTVVKSGNVVHPSNQNCVFLQTPMRGKKKKKKTTG